MRSVVAQVEGSQTLKAAKEAASSMEEATYAEQLHLDRLLGGKKSDQWCGVHLGSSMLSVPGVCGGAGCLYADWVPVMFSPMLCTRPAAQLKHSSMV